ncbi:hypothetical protein [Cellulomonas telluris]|uniref:hypothetical protein n=1 Tax=Cellulomonas telluris TaxID=2306636 RepID=UPI0010A85873|nr:hypothetical protein [Cellulomonas telluris]
MYLPDLLHGLRRRWWAVLLGLVSTAALAWTAFTMVPAERLANASVLVLPPPNTVDTGGNPYLALGGLSPAADVLATAMNNGSVHESLAPPGGTSTFVVSRDFDSSGPLLLVEASDPDPDAAIALLGTVLDTMPRTFADMQTRVDVPADARLTLSVVTQDATAQVSAKSQLRAVVVALVAGLGVTLFGTKALDGVLVRRRERRRAAQESEQVRARAQAGAPGQDAPADHQAQEQAEVEAHEQDASADRVEDQAGDAPPEPVVTPAPRARREAGTAPAEPHVPTPASATEPDLVLVPPRHREP